MSESFRLSDYVAFQRGGSLRSNERLPGVFVSRYRARLFGVLLAIDDDFPAADREVVLDVLVNRASVFPTAASRPRIPVGSFGADLDLEAAGIFVDLKRGDRIKVVVAQSGTSAATGHNLTAEVEYAYVF